MSRTIAVSMLMLGVAIASTAATAQTFPNKPIHIIAPVAVGGMDVTARVFAPKLGELLGQPIIIENRPGAAGAIGADAVARSDPDGYTLLFATSAQMVHGPLLNKATRYDPVKDFTPISKLMAPVEGVVLGPSYPFKTVEELVAFAKANPGKLTYGSSGRGTVLNFNGELLKHYAGIDMLHVPFNGAAPLMNEQLAGRIDLSFLGYNSIKGLVDTGKVRMLAVADPVRSPLLPNLPPITDAVPNYRRIPIWFGILGPAGMPPAVVERLHAALAAAVADPAVKAALERDYFVVDASTPAEFAATIASDRDLMRQLIDRLGFKAE